MGQILYAQATGNASVIDWNTAANGSGDSAPWASHAEDDTLEANTFSIAVDVDTFERAALVNQNGGVFTVNMDDAVGSPRTFTCELDAQYGGTLLYVTGGATSSGRLLKIIGNSIMAGAAGAGINHVARSLVWLTGDAVGGTVGSSNAFHLNNSLGSARIDGTTRCAYASAHPDSFGLYLTSGTAVVNDVRADATGTRPVAVYPAGANSFLTITGDLWFTGSGMPIRNYGFKWEPKPGKAIIVLNAKGEIRRIFPSAATGILGVGV
jgi:hypothetical protein